jgi:hypothetical protein
LGADGDRQLPRPQLPEPERDMNAAVATAKAKEMIARSCVTPRSARSIDEARRFSACAATWVIVIENDPEVSDRLETPASPSVSTPMA